MVVLGHEYAGFSTMTCLPAARAWSVRSRWKRGGTAMSTASTRGSSIADV
jgi:hypothetical protein